MAMEEEFATLKKNMDQFFLIVLGMLVFFMQCGFAFVEGGSVRSKSVTNILLKNFLDAFVAGIAYWLVGFALAFGKGNSFIGWTYFALYELPEDQLPYVFFEYVFASTSATVVSGALAERSEFVAYLIYSFIITGFIYPMITHWGWNKEGWLYAGGDYTFGNETINVGYRDYGGSGVVHAVGGMAALVGAAVLGPRIGRYNKDTGEVQDIKGHSTPLTIIGTFILLFGFLAFNGSNRGGISADRDGALMGLAVINSVIMASTAVMTTLFLSRHWPWGDKKWSCLKVCNVSISAMAAGCASCNVMDHWGAALTGIMDAIVYNSYAYLVLHKMKVDDPLDTFAVHFGGGTTGVMAVGLFDKTRGIFCQWNRISFLAFSWQLCGVITIIVWTGGVCLLTFGLLRVFKLFRVPEEIELKGLDIPKHGEPGYPPESWGHGWGKEADFQAGIVRVGVEEPGLPQYTNYKISTKGLAIPGEEEKKGGLNGYSAPYVVSDSLHDVAI